MLDARGIEGVRVLVGLHALAKQHASDVLEVACEIAHSHDAFQLRAIPSAPARDVLRENAAVRQVAAAATRRRQFAATRPRRGLSLAPP